MVKTLVGLVHQQPLGNERSGRNFLQLVGDRLVQNIFRLVGQDRRLEIVGRALIGVFGHFFDDVIRRLNQLDTSRRKRRFCTVVFLRPIKQSPICSPNDVAWRLVRPRLFYQLLFDKSKIRLILGQIRKKYFGKSGQVYQKIVQGGLPIRACTFWRAGSYRCPKPSILIKFFCRLL